MSDTSRILLCCENYPPSVGGVQEVMRQIAERLAAKGHEITVVTSSHPQRGQDTIRNGVRVVSFPIRGNRVNGIRGPVKEYHRFLQNNIFDAILIKAAQQWTFDAAIDVLPSIAARKVFIPCGFSGLSNPTYASYFGDMPHWLVMFDGLIFYSNDYQDLDFARKHGLNKIHIVPNGVDEREFSDTDSHGIKKSLGIEPDDDLLLSVGSLIAAKGHWEVLRAFGQAQLSRPTTLVINGNIPGAGLTTQIKRNIKHILSGKWPLSLERKWIEIRNANASLRKRVIYTDLSRPDLLDLYKATTLFIFASHVEYSPLVLFESAAAGTPFLASSAGNSREIAEWTGAGKICSSQNSLNNVLSTQTLSTELVHMLNNREALREFGEAGHRSIFNKSFTWNKIVDQYEQILCSQ